ncbi:MAG: hypothetical protein LBT92_03040 [Rickettsiales bacterium]|jgi:hypothetical protein|nr:hypothetical protein [Rickettsiales bacterium]
MKKSGFKVSEKDYKDYVRRSNRNAKIAGGPPRIRPAGQDFFDWLIKGRREMDATPEGRGVSAALAAIICNLGGPEGNKAESERYEEARLACGEMLSRKDLTNQSQRRR